VKLWPAMVTGKGSTPLLETLNRGSREKPLIDLVAIPSGFPAGGLFATNAEGTTLTNGLTAAGCDSRGAFALKFRRGTLDAFLRFCRRRFPADGSFATNACGTTWIETPEVPGSTPGGCALRRSHSSGGRALCFTNPCRRSNLRLIADSFFALMRYARERVEAMIQFLERDDYRFGTGYTKERIWRQLKREELKDRQKVRLKEVAIKYLYNPMRREFWYMCLCMSHFADDELRQRVSAIAESNDGEVRIKAQCLLAYLRNASEGGRMRRKYRQFGGISG